MQALKLLLDSFIWLDVKAKNLCHLTALEIVQNVEGKAMNNGENDAKIKDLKTKVKGTERFFTAMARRRNSTSMDMINALLVIMALVITATYQSSLSPPGGVWLGDNSSTVNTTTTTTSNVTRHFLARNSCNNQSITNSVQSGQLGKAGREIRSLRSYSWFWTINCSTFVFTIIITIFLLSSVSLFELILTPLSLLGSSYFSSMGITSPSTGWLIVNYIFLCIYQSLPLCALLFRFKHIEKIRGQQADRTKFIQFLDMGNNIGIIHRLRRRIKATFTI